MCRTSNIALIVSIAGIGFLAGRYCLTVGESAALAAQPEAKKPMAQPPAKGDKPEMPGGMTPQMIEQMTKASTIGAEHKNLEVMIGKFEGTVKFRMAPDAAWMESKGTATREWGLDGHFVMEHVDAEAGGMAFKGLGITGYNTVENRYESVWIENMGTYVAFAKGSYDAAKKTFVFEGDMIDPASGKRRHERMVMDFSNPDRQTMASYASSPDVKEFKCFEGVMERVKKDAGGGMR